MSGKDAALEQALNRNRSGPPPRPRLFIPNYDLAYEDVPEGVKALVVRLDMPYLRIDLPIPAEVAEKIGRQLIAAHIIVPDATDPLLKG